MWQDSWKVPGPELMAEAEVMLRWKEDALNWHSVPDSLKRKSGCGAGKRKTDDHKASSRLRPDGEQNALSSALLPAAPGPGGLPSLGFPKRPWGRQHWLIAEAGLSCNSSANGTWPSPRRVWKRLLALVKILGPGRFSTKKFTALKKCHRLFPVPNSGKIKWRDSLLFLGEMTDSKRAFSFSTPKKVCQRYKYLKTGARLRGLAFPVSSLAVSPSTTKISFYSV